MKIFRVYVKIKGFSLTGVFWLKEEIPPMCWGTKALTCSIPAPQERQVGRTQKQRRKSLENIVRMFEN